MAEENLVGAIGSATSKSEVGGAASASAPAGGTLAASRTEGTEGGKAINTADAVNISDEAGEDAGETNPLGGLFGGGGSQPGLQSEDVQPGLQSGGVLTPSGFAGGDPGLQSGGTFTTSYGPVKGQE
ncbi:MAG: hypothetical protein FJX76_14070 [Armatimonadetes bacterium]|nr:hypothetical protein [Armatimonadota bacterium]